MNLTLLIPQLPRWGQPAPPAVGRYSSPTHLSEATHQQADRTYASRCKCLQYKSFCLGRDIMASARAGISQWPWRLCPFILNSVCPSKKFTPCSHRGLLPHLHLPSIILTLFFYFLLCLTSVITVFRHQCLVIGFWYVIDQTLLKQWVVSLISTLAWTAGKRYHNVSYINLSPSNQETDRAHPDATQLAAEMADWATEVKKVWWIGSYELDRITVKRQCLWHYVYVRNGNFSWRLLDNVFMKLVIWPP